MSDKSEKPESLVGLLDGYIRRTAFYENELGVCLKTGDRLDSSGKGPPWIRIPGVGRIVHKDVAHEWLANFGQPRPRARRKRLQTTTQEKVS